MEIIYDESSALICEGNYLLEQLRWRHSFAGKLKCSKVFFAAFKMSTAAKGGTKHFEQVILNFPPNVKC